MGRKTLKPGEAAKLGRAGAKKRSESLTKKRRSEIAKLAAQARWSRAGRKINEFTNRRLEIWRTSNAVFPRHSGMYRYYLWLGLSKAQTFTGS